MHLAPLIHDLAVILIVAGLVSLLFQKIRQPVVLGYIIAGMIVGPYTPPYSFIKDIPNIQVWAELGIIFLMFSPGLEFSFRKLTSVGLSAGIVAFFDVGFMLFFGFMAGKILGWSTMDCFFLGGMVSISSTTIIIKALDELGLKTKRFAEMIFAVLIVEDLLAVILLVALSTVAINKTVSGLTLLNAGLRLVLVVGSWFLAGYFLVPRYMRYVGKIGSKEMLLISSIGLCLMLVAFAAYFDYSVALGAFIMGSILAESSESHKIEKLVAPLKDLFAAIFFVSVGMLIDPMVLVENFGAVLLITCVTVMGKILAITLGSLISGQSLKHSVQVGFGLAQIGEFSFIIATLGHNLGVTRDSLYPIAVAVSLITTFLSPYLIGYSEAIASRLEGYLPPGLREVLDMYGNWAQGRRAESSKKQEFFRLVLRWFLNGLTITSISVFTAEGAMPFLLERFGTNSPLIIGSLWAFSLICSLPFLWAMWTSFRAFRLDDSFHGIAAIVSAGPLKNFVSLFFQLLSLIWFFGLGVEFFPGKVVGLICALTVFGYFGLFYHQLDKAYHWVEKRFLSTFEEVPESTAQPKSKVATDERLKHLVPFDAHLVRLDLHPNAFLVKKSLMESELRRRFGVNVIAIQRGLETLIAPKPDEVLLPFDEVLVLGNDEQIDSIRNFFDAPSVLMEHSDSSLLRYELRPFKVQSHAMVESQTVRQSGIREKYHCMVVGLERAGSRIMNPDSDLLVAHGDILWIVGERRQVDDLAYIFETPENRIVQNPDAPLRV